MSLKKSFGVLVSLTFLLVTGAASAVVQLIIDPATGKLAGATGVQVFVAIDDDEPDTGATQCFDVRFEDSRCGDLIPGCDGVSAFVIPNSPSARNAAQALLDQVFQDGPLGPEDDFDSDPSLTQGCSVNPDFCALYVPYRKDAPQDMLVHIANNSSNPAADSTQSTRGPLANGSPADVAEIDWTATYLPTLIGTDNATWAVFSPCAMQPVPEPATFYYLLYGLAGLVLISVVRSQTKRRS